MYQDTDSAHVREALAERAHDDDRTVRAAAAFHRERAVRDGPLMDRLRVGELKRIAADAASGGVVNTYQSGERLFRCALPHLLALPTLTRRGFPGAGELGQFAYNHALAFYRAKGARYFDDLRRDFETFRKKPSRMKADHVARVLGITLAERARLDLRTIGASDRPKAERTADRKASDAAYQRDKRKGNGATPRDVYEANSAARTKPWEALGISRRTYYRRSRGTSSSAIRDVVSMSNVDELVPPSPQSLASPAGPTERVCALPPAPHLVRRRGVTADPTRTLPRAATAHRHAWTPPRVDGRRDRLAGDAKSIPGTIIANRNAGGARV